MSLNEFAMVEELAFLIKDNLPCKHLILTMEEALVQFLQDDMSSDGVLELTPMSSYNRLLLHRLADIFGFSHHSVGEGDERHLVLERCAETSVPAILVSDLLGQYDELEYPNISDILSRKKEASPGLNVELPRFNISLEEREAAYLAARERIFSVDDSRTRGVAKQRPPNDPIVARRMIAHALGQRIKPNELAAEISEDLSIQDKEQVTHKKLDKVKTNLTIGCGSSHGKSMTEKNVDAELVSSGSKRIENILDEDCFRKEHMGAAKRMFANALGSHLRDGSKSRRNGLKPASGLSLE